MINFGNNLEEFINNFKEKVVNKVYWRYPKEYRKSDEYYSQDLDEKFEEALNSYYGKQAILNAIEEYYVTIKEYEEILGY